MIDPYRPEEMRPSDAPEGHQATTAPPDPENAPQGMDDASMGGPNAWAACVDMFYGQGPTPPASTSDRDIHRLTADLEILNWSVRPCAHGGWFCWSETGTEFCAEVEDLRAFARRANREHKQALKATGKTARQDYKERLSGSIGRVSSALKTDRPKVDRKLWRADVFEAFGRELAKATFRPGDQQGGS